MDLFLRLDNIVQISSLSCGFTQIPIYQFTKNGNTYAVYTTLLGDSGSAALMEEVIAKGGETFLFFGSCGVLDKNIVANHLVIPTHAYRRGR